MKILVKCTSAIPAVKPKNFTMYRFAMSQDRIHEVDQGSFDGGLWINLDTPGLFGVGQFYEFNIQMEVENERF